MTHIAATATRRLACWVAGHWWDSDRPKGPLGYCPDTCWRCHATRPCPEPKRNPHECRPTERTDQMHDATIVSDLPDPETAFRVGEVEGAWTPLEAWVCPFPGLIVVAIDDGVDLPHAVFGCSARALTPDEARNLAAWLLAAAQHIDTKENPND